ncbi:MAG: transglutaminase-like domain-containing protein [Candidatus Poribacteria bacterium]|nr:transglutaminase-like domain-containing protein [Candidatus Poribacteria bacterium]
MCKQFLAIGFTLLLMSLATYADEMVYQIKMSGRAVGYTRYELVDEGESVMIQTTVRFTLGQGEFDQEIKLIADTRLNAQTLLPVAYHLSTYINGFTQSTIDTQFEENVAKQEILAGGQTFDNEIELPTPTYIADSNFRVDHYNVVLGQYDFKQAGAQSFHTLTPLETPQSPAAVPLTLTWKGGEQITVGNTTYQTDWLEASINGTAMEFWYDREAGRIVKWTIPSQESEVLLADDSLLPTTAAVEDLATVLRRAKELPRIQVDQDLGNLSDLVSLQAHLDLHVVTSGQPPIDLPHQKFDGEMSREGETVRINGVVTVMAIESPKAKATRLPIHPGDFADPFIQPESEIESEHPEIGAKAKEITASAQTAYEATKAVVDWVTTEIRYDSTSVSAHRCLSTQAGDAVSRSRLVVALLRALNIPARIIGGLVYSNNREFVQHHWVEVYIGADAGWMPVDALTGETETFSAGHISLWRGVGSCATELSEMAIRIFDFQSAAIAWQDLVPLQVGEQNRYRFIHDGQPIGDCTSHVKDILTYHGIKCYEIDATLNLDSDRIGQIDAQAKLYLTLDGKPMFYQLSKNDESWEYLREGKTFSYTHASGRMGEAIPHMGIDRDAYFIGDNMFWQWDLMFRKQELFTGMHREISAFNPQSRMPYRIQMVVEGVEEIEFDGQKFQCFRVKVDGGLFWISSVGRFIRYENPGRKLVVELAVQE